MRRVIPASVIAATLALAGCGGSSTPGPRSHATPAYALAQCMRAHGVPNFPDPRIGPGGQGFSVVQADGGPLTVNGIPFSGPAFNAADRACRFGPQSGPGGGISATQKAQLLANARCIRQHGLPSFPDPQFGAQGGVLVPLGPGQDPRSPAIQRAARDCRKVGQPLPGVGVG